MISKYAVFFDIETTVSADIAVTMDTPPVCQIAAVAIDEYGNELETFEVKILFKNSDPEILQLIGYTPERWKDAIPPLPAARQFIAFVSKYKCIKKISKRGNPYNVALLGGHNVNDFDIPVIMQWYRGLADHFNANLFFPASYRPSIDTLELVRAYQSITGEFGKAGLKDLCAEHGVELEHHDAVSDVRATVKIWNIYRTLFYEYHERMIGSNVGPTGEPKLTGLPE